MKEGTGKRPYPLQIFPLQKAFAAPQSLPLWPGLTAKRLLGWFRRLGGNDQRDDLRIGGSGNNVLGLELGFVGVGAAGNDLGRIHVANARQGLKLIFGG